MLSAPADIAEAGLYATDVIPDHPPVDLREGPWVPHEPPGNYHLVVDAIWRHGKTGWGQTGTEEWARFLFPVEIVGGEEPTSPTPVESSPTTPAPPSSNPILLVSSQGANGDLALLEGELALRNGCVGVQNGEVFTYLIWPAGTSLTSPSEPLAVVDGSGAEIASIGDTIRISGGVDFLGRAEGVVDGGIPPACAEDGEHYWYVGQIAASPTAASPADVLRVSCEGGQTTVLTPYVQVRPDGLHVIVEGDTAGVEAVILANSSNESVRGSVWNSGSDGVEDEFTRPVPPGRGHVLCGRTGETISYSENVIPEAIRAWPAFCIVEPGQPSELCSEENIFGPEGISGPLGRVVTVPDLTGLPLEDAASDLEVAGLVLGDVQAATGGYANEAVVRQDPAPGEETEPRTAVDVVMGPAGTG